MTRRVPVSADDSPEPRQVVPVRCGPPARSAAVLCPGPSLSSFEDADGYDLRIGVNRAAGAFRCDYWVALDVHTAGITSLRGAPIVVNKLDIHQKMCREFGYVARLGHLSVESLRLRGRSSAKINWQRFGATVALVLATELGAARIDYFGVDWQGQADFDGFLCLRSRRNTSRWRRERELWGEVVAALAERGVIVRRRVGHEADAAEWLQITNSFPRE